MKALFQAAKTELLASPLRRDDSGPVEDQDFLYELWQSHTDADIWAASPSLKKAFVEWVQYKAEDIINDFDEILSNVNGRNHLEICDVSDFEEACWDEWEEKKPKSKAELDSSQAARFILTRERKLSENTPQ